jgi:T5SS/PEP-CTERM-associated repeat protein
MTKKRYKCLVLLGGLAVVQLTLAANWTIDDSGTYIVSVDTSYDNESVYVGYTETSENHLEIIDGAVLENFYGTIGYGYGVDDNSVTVSGGGSSWINSSLLWVGRNGFGNSLTVSNGATVSNTGGYLGWVDGSDNNHATVTGSGSIWTNSGNLYIGYKGDENSMAVSDGASVVSKSAYIGYWVGSDNNSVTVTGENSMWKSSDGFYVGPDSVGNSLFIEDGGTVMSGSSAYIGSNSSSSNNSVSVSGNDSLWSHSGNLYVGYGGAGNTLSILDGATVTNSECYMGVNSAADNNRVVVSGSGSSWVNSSALYVGRRALENSVSVQDGAHVEVDSAYIGYYLSSSNNSVMVSGTGTILANNSDSHVGYYGSNNSMLIEDGATVVNAKGAVGTLSGAAYNNVMIRGGGSSWVNNSSLTIGNISGNGNSLTIEDGGTASALSTLVYENNELRFDDGTLDLNGGDFTLNGILALEGVGNLNGDLLMSSTGELELMLDGYSDYGTLGIAGNWAIDGTLTVLFSEGFSVTNGAFFDLFDCDGTLSGEFADVELAALSNGLSWDTTSLYSNGVIGVVPEPATLGLIGLSGIGFLVVRRFFMV